MEKNENEELLEQSPAEIQQEDTQKIAKSGKEEPDTEEQKVSNGRFILWSLAGVYLLYTSYSLCKGYVTGEEGTSMGFMLAGIAFAAIGAGLLFFGIKNMLSEEKIKKAKAAKNAAMEAAAGGELKKEAALCTDLPLDLPDTASHLFFRKQSVGKYQAFCHDSSEYQIFLHDRSLFYFPIPVPF